MLTELWPERIQDVYEQGSLPEQYIGVDRVDIVHMDPNWPIDCNRPAEATVLTNMRALLPILECNGIEIRRISGPDLDQQTEDVSGKRIAIWGAVADVCCQIRRDLLKEAGATEAWIDPAMVSTC